MEFTPICYEPSSGALTGATSNSTHPLKKYSPAQQARWVALWQKSQLTQMQFCKQHGLNIKTFNCWKNKVVKSQLASCLPETKTIEKPPSGKGAQSDVDKPSSVESTIKFQACMLNGVVLKFDALPIATAIELIKGVCNAN